MAYGNLLASVPPARIALVRSVPSASLDASLVADTSHLLAYWVKLQPLGRLLGETLDGGEPLGASFWHPLRGPRVLGPERVSQLARELQAAWDETVQTASPDPTWRCWSADIALVVELLVHASHCGEAVVSALDLPEDEASASRVVMPKLTRFGTWPRPLWDRAE